MVRKTHKGIVGKFPMASKRDGEVGPGLDFKSENLTTTPEIQKEFRVMRNEK